MLGDPVEVTNRREFEGLRDPYTGDPIRVFMRFRRGGVPVFYSEGAYSPSTPWPTAVEAEERALMRGGVTVGNGPARVPTCPYTGKVLRLRRVDGVGFLYAGGRDPRVPKGSVRELAAWLWERNGVVPAEYAGKPAEITRSEAVEDFGKAEEPPDDGLTTGIEEAVKNSVVGPAVKAKRPKAGKGK